MKGLELAAMAALCAAAHAFPAQLLLLAYAVVGPAHYLTQLSWLWDRDFFSKDRAATAALALLAAPLALAGLGTASGLAWAALALGAVGASGAVPRPAAAAGVVLLLALHAASPLPAAAALLLPGLAHILLFTGLFLCWGALLRGSWGDRAAFPAFLACAASFWLLPMAPVPAPGPGSALGYFTGSMLAARDYLGLSDAPGAVSRGAGLLAFAYSYHYANWFAKVELLSWHRMPRPRLIGLGAAYAALLCLYAWDFDLGFVIAGLLGMLHVTLELPLDWLTARDVGRRLVGARL